MKIVINPFGMFKTTDTIVAYKKKGEWYLATFTDGYKLSRREKSDLIDFVMAQYKISNSDDIKFLKWHEIIGIEDEK